MKNAITWFEIGTANLARATAFYEAVLGQKIGWKIWGHLKALCLPTTNPQTVQVAPSCAAPPHPRQALAAR